MNKYCTLFILGMRNNGVKWRYKMERTEKISKQTIPR